MKKQKIQLIIIAVLLVLFIAGYFMLKNSNLKDEDDSEKTSDIKVTNVVSGDVVEMEYLKDGQTLDFIKDGDSWYYKDDRSIPIIQTDLTTMLDYACSISTKTVIDAPEDLKTLVQLLADKDHLRGILAEGAQKARYAASKILRKVRKKTGLTY